MTWYNSIPDFIKGTTFEDSYAEQLAKGTPKDLIDIPRHLIVKKTGHTRVNPNSFIDVKGTFTPSTPGDVTPKQNDFVSIPLGESKVDLPKSNNSFNSLDPDQFI